MSPARGEHHQVARTFTQKSENANSRVLSRKECLIDFNSESTGNYPGRIVLVRKSPLHEQLTNLGECLCAAGVSLFDMKQVQLTLCGQGNTQGMCKRCPAKIGKIGRMQDRFNGHFTDGVMPDFVPSMSF